VLGACSMPWSAGGMPNKFPSDICEVELRLGFDTYQ
jgi:hypothetical protein